MSFEGVALFFFLRGGVTEMATLSSTLILNSGKSFTKAPLDDKRQSITWAVHCEIIVRSPTRSVRDFYLGAASQGISALFFQRVRKTS